MMEKIKLIELPKIEDFRGNLTFIENGTHLPFEIKRVYWIYDVPGGQIRGGHAFKNQNELVVALSGSLDVVVHTGSQENKIHLNRSYYGVLIQSGIWRHMENFSTNSVAMVLSSTFFYEDDYIRDFNQFLKYSKHEK